MSRMLWKCNALKIYTSNKPNLTQDDLILNYSIINTRERMINITFINERTKTPFFSIHDFLVRIIKEITCIHTFIILKYKSMACDDRNLKQGKYKIMPYWLLVPRLCLVTTKWFSNPYIDSPWLAKKT